jgi:hypothetical protein
MGALLYLLLTSAFTASFYWPRSVAFSFSSPNCFTSPTLLPNLITKHPGKTFSADPAPTLSIAGYPLYSHTTCVTPVQAPEKGAAETLSFSPAILPFLKKHIRVSAGNLPTISSQAPLAGPISIKDPLVFPLTMADRVFEYQLLVNDQKVACGKEKRQVTCDVSKLELAQSASYTFAMQRVFGGEAHDILFEQQAATVGAVQVTSSSIAPGQTVYNVPAELTLTLNKSLKSFEGVELTILAGADRQAVPITTTGSGDTITVRFDEPLARSTTFELSVKNIAADDGGYLPVPYFFHFATSGGPKVKSLNIGSSKVSTTASVTVTFDANVLSDQSVGDFVRLEINGQAVAASATLKGNTVTLKPTNALSRCTDFTVRVLDGLKNEFGISGGSAYQFKSRTICQTVFSIGTSVQGRSITAYRFGIGSSYVVFIGGMHGNEKSSTYSLNSLIDYLEAHDSQIPANRSIIVIPNLNPDGYAVTKRTNANNVDLNRNFPANNWKQGVTMPDKTYNPNGGGAYPLSEPESSAIANYILSVKPRLVLTYHAAAGVVMPNDAGDSDALARVYDQKSNLGYEPSSQTGAIFEYDTTGSFEEWLYDKHGIPTLLVELWTTTKNEYSKNQDAMWHMVQLP